MYCLCVNVYCHRVTTQLQLTNISYLRLSLASDLFLVVLPTKCIFVLFHVGHMHRPSQFPCNDHSHYVCQVVLGVNILKRNFHQLALTTYFPGPGISLNTLISIILSILLSVGNTKYHVHINRQHLCVSVIVVY